MTKHSIDKLKKNCIADCSGTIASWHTKDPSPLATSTQLMACVLGTSRSRMYLLRLEVCVHTCDLCVCVHVWV